MKKCVLFSISPFPAVWYNTFMQKTNIKNTLFITQAAVIAALYVTLTILAWGFDLASGMIQCRFSEALTVLPFFTPAAVPGLFAGCLLANFITGAALPDIIFGSIATLIGALGTYMLRKHRFLCSWPPVIANSLIIPFVLRFAYGVPDMIPFMMLTVGAGEIITCVIFGQLLISALQPVQRIIFKSVSASA